LIPRKITPALLPVGLVGLTVPVESGTASIRPPFSVARRRRPVRSAVRIALPAPFGPVDVDRGAVGSDVTAAGSIRRRSVRGTGSRFDPPRTTMPTPSVRTSVADHRDESEVA
jgi:hypothetical protein